jgi:DNA-binding phage protein
MNDTQRIEQLLTQILDTQRAHLAEYTRVAAQSLAMQRTAVDTQARHVRLYRRAIAVGAIILGALVLVVAWMARLLP